MRTESTGISLLTSALSLLLTAGLAIVAVLLSRQLLIFAMFAVVFFTLLVQGFSLRWILKGVPSVSE